MSLDSTALSRLRARLAEERAKAMEQMITGQLLDLKSYGYSCGYVRALDDTIVILEEILTDIQGN